MWTLVNSGVFNPKMMEVVEEKLRCVIKCALTPEGFCPKIVSKLLLVEASYYIEN